ncbi:MAG: ATP-dependent Clp protease adaptor ClpS [Bacteroidales bacterium]|jgi:ATP-dependent Clp protease adaptor protein ClpS|nr:ATP-dependent Clp protease adaptor ClpS [Bacteroidales bacterium]
MSEDQNIKKQVSKNDIVLNKNRKLVLYNDDVNTFDYVIECLVEICGHELVQAEQCAFITHYKGKCDVKSGDYRSMKRLKEHLVDRGLRVTID